MTTVQKFTPADDQRAFRDALGRFTTGVTVITANSEDGPLGIAANSFASVSLEPPLVLWSIAKSSKRYAYFTKCAHFVIHVLHENQDALANGFARDKHAFEGLTWHKNANDAPVIEPALAHFECHLHALHDAGDHTIIVGHVDHASHGMGKGLCFGAGKYGDFNPRA